MSNTIAIVLKVIGWMSAIGALIAAIALGLNETSTLAIFTRILILVGGIISCAVFNGFGEVIDLLEYNAEVQTDILEYLKERDKKDQTPQEGVE